MATGSKPKPQAPARPAKSLWLVYLLSWLVPGGGHLWLGRRQKGIAFLIALPAMFAIGLALDGRLFQLFPLDWSEPLVALAAIADVGAGLPWLVTWVFGLGAGLASAVTYEYGNAFMITAGLLNALVVIDAHDIALGRK
jgi:hypothetical protein